jgi:hypothetical protein
MLIAIFSLTVLGAVLGVVLGIANKACGSRATRWWMSSSP